jgi:hypothetical protein
MVVLEHLVAIMEETKAKVDTKQEKLEAKVETSQEKTGAIAEHYIWSPCIKATHLLTASQDWACDFYLETSMEQLTRRLSV